MGVEGWSDFFVAVAGASAALAGLIIVAMSVNIETIVTSPALPARAAATIAVLMLVVLVAVLALVPAVPSAVAGWGIVVLAAATLAITADTTVRELRDRLGQGILKSAVLVLPALAFLVGDIMLAATIPNGVYLVALGTILAFAGGVLNAWVLLVEVRR